MKTIIIEPKYNIGDIIYPKIEPESRLMVIGYNVVSVDENGECSDLLYLGSGKDGEIQHFRDYEIELIEARCI